VEILVPARIALGDHDGAASSLQELATISDATPTPPLRAATSFSAGVVAVASGVYAEARRRFEDALDLSEQAGAPYEVARARLELAGVLSGLGQTELAETEANAALTALRQLGAAREAERAATLIGQLQRQRSGHNSAPGPVRDLTARELEVLRLIASGMGDKEIATTLGLSLHTIHRHVSNILTKLDVPSRAAAVAYAAQRGLL
jgi:ATP/maltotriose-dependent transcriptional regulator MalT